MNGSIVHQDRANQVQSDLEELVKALNERCKTYGLRAKPTSILELPFGNLNILMHICHRLHVNLTHWKPIYYPLVYAKICLITSYWYFILYLLLKHKKSVVLIFNSSYSFMQLFLLESEY